MYLSSLPAIFIFVSSTTVRNGTITTTAATAETAIRTIIDSDSSCCSTSRPVVGLHGVTGQNGIGQSGTDKMVANFF